MNKQPFGIFDSGVGGTSIWKEIHALLPNEHTIYLADSNNAPYGSKGKEAIIDLCIKNTELLISKGCKLIVVACNTATTNAINVLRSTYNIPFIGIEPAIKPAALQTKTNTIGILATGKRFTVNMISAISNRGHLQFMLMDAGFNSEVFQTFLEQMIKYSKQKVFFITENHPAHKTKKLNQWLEDNKKKIEVLFIPAYSPELNPQQYLNQDLKTNIIGKKRAINKEQLKKNINNFMSKRKKDKPQVKKYFHHKNAQYAA